MLHPLGSRFWCSSVESSARSTDRIAVVCLWCRPGFPGGYRQEADSFAGDSPPVPSPVPLACLPGLIFSIYFSSKLNLLDTYKGKNLNIPVLWRARGWSLRTHLGCNPGAFRGDASRFLKKSDTGCQAPANSSGCMCGLLLEEWTSAGNWSKGCGKWLGKPVMRACAWTCRLNSLRPSGCTSRSASCRRSS